MNYETILSFTQTIQPTRTFFERLIRSGSGKITPLPILTQRPERVLVEMHYGGENHIYIFEVRTSTMPIKELSIKI